MKSYIKILFVSLCLVWSMNVALAVPPPDFLFNIGSSIAQVFSVIVLFASAALAATRQFFKTYFMSIKHKKLVWTALGLFVVAGSFGGAYLYQQYQQDQAYAEWLADSEVGQEVLKQVQNDVEKEDNKVMRMDAYQTFISTYYQNIAEGNYEEAYEVSKKSVSLATFTSWYDDVEEVIVEEMEKLDDLEYQILVKLVESDEISTYEVVMNLEHVEPDGIKIASSDSNLVNSEAKGDVDPDPQKKNNNSTKAMAVGNSEFAAIVSAGNAYVLDAREDEEYEYGQYPGSVHIRFADLLDGEWRRVPTNQTIYVFCWSGMRGKDVAEFLVSKGLDARYVKDGANGWVEYGGEWNGEIKFLHVHPESEYTRLFTADEVRAEMNTGTVIIDSREPSKYQAGHIPGSVNIPVIHTPSRSMEAALAQVPAGSRVITVCDGRVSCFDAKLGGLKLARKGCTFLGRFNRPGELY